MTTKLRFVAPTAASLATVLLAASPSFAASWQTNVRYGGNTPMDLYVPDNVDASPGVVVSLHYCSGRAANAHGWFQALADQHGFVIITPQAGGNCFDATPARSGEREAISKMVEYVITQNHADPRRVFAAGASSGACMTQALLAAYPDVFAGGSVLAGVPAGAWTGGNAYGWTTPANRSAAEWGEIVRKAHPGFTGTRPRVQLWHGTADNTLNYNPNFPAEVAQWTNVLGVTDANATTGSFRGSQDTWTRVSYKNTAGVVVLETNVAQNAPHDLSGRGLWGDVVRFFGLDMDPPTSSTSSGEGGGAATGSGGADGGGGNGAGGAETSSSSGGAETSSSSSSGGAETSGSSSGSSSGGAETSGSSSGGSGGGAVSSSSGGGGAASSSSGASSASGGVVASGSGGGAPGDDDPESDSGCSLAVGASGGRSGALAAMIALGAMLYRRGRRRS